MQSPLLHQRPSAVALLGPTASGKSALAMRVAKMFDGEIVSVDSALIYRHLDIGSAKPTPAERAEVPHHLLDLREPWQPYCAAEFVSDARNAVSAIHARGRLPVLAGGTSLYAQALLHGLAPMPPADPTLREAITAEASLRGWRAMHEELARIDTTAARRIKPGDAQRIQRALEVFRATGTPISVWQARQAQVPRWPVRVLLLALLPPREVERTRIAKRFDAMLEAGFLDEVRTLRALPPLSSHPDPLSLPALRAVGYRQAWEHLSGETNFTQFRERAIHATSQLAKRQRTWLKSRLDVRVLDPAQGEAAVLDAVSGFLASPSRRR